MEMSSTSPFMRKIEEHLDTSNTLASSVILITWKHFRTHTLTDIISRFTKMKSTVVLEAKIEA
jgi:hypothetical protein